MIDTSGSMDMNPEEYPEDDVGWRMDRMKAIFHDFILKLPQGTLMQLDSFSEPGMFSSCPTGYHQTTTDQKGTVLSALGYLYGLGGTPTNEALFLAYHNLAPILSKKGADILYRYGALLPCIPGGK